MRGSHLRHGASWLLLGAVLAAAGCVALARGELAHLREAFETDARIAHRILSQRAVQHDAILATLALLQPPPGPSTAERRLPALYPQILGVQRRDADASWTDPALAVAEVESRKRKRPALARVDFANGRYELVLGADPASFAMRMDMKAAVPWSEWPMDPAASPVQVLLAHANQRFLLQPGRVEDSPWRFEFRKHLAADSQPFDVVAVRSVGWAELPWGEMAAWCAAIAVLVAALAAWRGQREQRERAEELLRLGQVGRLNTLGELAAGMAHELNQPLAALLANTQAASRLLAEDPPDLETARGAMRQSAEQARRASDVLARLRRAVERPHDLPAPQPMALEAAARNALYLLEPEIARRQVDARIEAGPAPLTVLAEPVALEQIVHNLLLNALQALDRNPRGERQLRVVLAPRDREGLLSVIDNGPGIAAGDLPHVFEPFFSTREQGLGLGLSLCESLAAGMGGRLEAANASPRGAAFHLHLPLAEAA